MFLGLEREREREIMSKYGLNLRPQQKKQPAKPPLPKILGFGNDDDDDNIEKEISRHAVKNKSLRDVSILLSPLLIFAKRCFFGRSPLLC